MMKGISPLVASVLLIAITMSVAGILAFWVSSYTGQTLPKVNRTEEECRFSNFEIFSCILYNATGNLTLTLRNIGSYDLTQLKAQVFLTDGTVTQPLNLEGTLPRGEFRTYVISTGISTDKFSKVVVLTSLCPQLSSEESNCELR
ncbi:MAG: archaellin/type IV pilin N-terminal domain-containing protein [Candidatus Aenigmatarchaeota archaeon]